MSDDRGVLLQAVAAMSGNSALWNAVDTIISAWADELHESLETNTEPDWGLLSGDLESLQMMAYKLAGRQEQPKARPTK